jgi:hypothetical protein
LLADDTRVGDASKDVLGRSNTREVLSADIGSSLLESKSRTYMTAVAFDLTLFAVTVVHLVVAAAGVVACTLVRTILSTHVDGSFTDHARRH